MTLTELASRKGAAMDFQLDIFLESFPTLLKGAVLTVELTVISVVLGLLIGLIGALGRISRSRMLRGLTFGYITLMRAVPLLLTLMFLYYGLPSAGIDLSAFTIAIIALSVTNGAYVTEIIRAGIEFDRSGPDARRPFARHVLLAGDAPHHSAAGRAPRVAPDHQRSHHLAQEHRPGLDHCIERPAALRPRSDDLESQYV